MNNNDEFSPENVEEQIEQISYSLHGEPLSSSTQVIQELHTYYKEDQHSAERMWERLIPYVTEHESTILPASDQPETVNKIFEEQMLPNKSERYSSRKKFAPQLALIAAVFCTFLIVGSLLFVFQLVHSTHTGSFPSASPHGLYISRKGEVSRLDPLTRKTIWRTIVPKSGIATGNLVVLHNIVYLQLTDQLYALNTSDGHIRWSDKNFQAFPLDVVDGLLYAEGDPLTAGNTLYVLNPANGKIQATYTHPKGKGWNSPTVANGILYYGIGADLYAMTLTNQQIAWRQSPVAPSAYEKSIIENIQVQNGVVYAQVMVMHTHTSTPPDFLIIAFDARTGKKLWGSKTGTKLSAITNTAVYTTSVNLSSSAQLDAFDAHTGRQLWHQVINPSKIQIASDWHAIIKILVDSDTLYVSYGNKSSAGGIVALRASDGTLLWQTKADNQEADSPQSISDRMVYAISYNNTNGAIDAFKTSDGSQLWHMAIKGDANEWKAVIA